MRSHIVLMSMTLCLCIGLIVPGAALGSEAEDSASQACGNCFWTAPRPECAMFFATDLHVMYRFNDPSYGWPGNIVDDEREAVFAAVDFGPMFNLNQNNTIGVTAHFGVDVDLWRLGLKGRYRYWLSKRSYFDVGAGAILAKTESGGKFPAGATFSLSYAPATWVAFTVAHERLHFEKTYSMSEPVTITGTERLWYGGITLGSKPGAVGALAGGAVVGAIILIVGFGLSSGM